MKDLSHIKRTAAGIILTAMLALTPSGIAQGQTKIVAGIVKGVKGASNVRVTPQVPEQKPWAKAKPKQLPKVRELKVPVPNVKTPTKYPKLASGVKGNIIMPRDSAAAKADSLRNDSTQRKE